ncbi:MAG: GNAT family N-acetyltransferase [Bacteroidetes bacterium]|nr:GNAT family N-acetyltransferase [Bacteroidota bacterium]
MLFEELQTQRLLLRKFTPATYKHLFENESDEFIIQCLALKDYSMLLQEKEKYMQGMSTFNKSFVTFKLFDKQSHLPIGNCGFHTWYVTHARAEIGYDIMDNSWKGKGVMTEALQAIIPYGFDQLQLNRIEAFIGPNNTPSLKLMHKFGFQQEGLLRAHYCKNGILEDSLVFSLLKNEYYPTNDEINRSLLPLI